MDFYKAFRNARRETFRLEMLDEYRVEDEKEDFAAWKNKEPRKLSAGGKSWIADL